MRGRCPRWWCLAAFAHSTLMETPFSGARRALLRATGFFAALFYTVGTASRCTTWTPTTYWARSVVPAWKMMAEMTMAVTFRMTTTTVPSRQ